MPNPAALELKKLNALLELPPRSWQIRTPLILKLVPVPIPIPVYIVANSSHSKSINAILKPHI